MSAYGSRVMAATLLAAACGGSDSAGLGPEPDPAGAWQGNWVGKWGAGSATPTSDYTLVIGINRVLIVYNGLAGTGAPQGAGSWTLENGAFRGKYAYTEGDTLFVTGALANNGTRIQGDWGRGSETQGTYWADRQ